MKKQKIKLFLIMVLSCLLLFSINVLIDLIGNEGLVESTEPSADLVEKYTWEEYQQLSVDEKAVFPDRFESLEDYEQWYKDENPELSDEQTLLIDFNDKKVEEFTWEEYQELSADEKAVFPDYFENMEDYTQWYDKTNPEFVNNQTAPTDSDKKSSEEFTWEEYQKLSADEKAEFPDRFENMEKYEQWYKATNPELNDNQIFKIELGNKKAEEFTWEEYQSLSVDEKAIFPDYFEDMNAYEKWYNSAKPN